MQHIISKSFLLVMVIVIGTSLSFVAQSARNYHKTVNLIAGKADTVSFDGAVADILVADPSIADVEILRSNRLYLVGRKIGDTNILAYDDAGNQLANIDVHVRADDKNLQLTLKEFFPDEKIRVRTVKNNIVLTGEVSNPSVSNQVRDLVSRFITEKDQSLVDLMTVQGDQQVMLKVKVVEIRRSLLRDLGVDMDFRNVDGIAKGLIFGGEDVGRAALTPFATGAFFVGSENKLGFGPMTMLIKALEDNGMVNVLAEPTLTAISGETAGFLAGGEFPVPTGRDAQGNVIIEFKQFGVSLNFTPTVLSKNRIALHLSTEVSEKDSTVSVTLVDLKVDGLRVRRAETTVEMASGSTLMIAGLIKSDTVDAMKGFPGLQDIPILGALFKSKSFIRNESELLIMVTPYLVKPYREPEAVFEEDEPSKLGKVLEKFKPRKAEQNIIAKQEEIRKAQRERLLAKIEELKKKYSSNNTDSDPARTLEKSKKKHYTYDDGFESRTASSRTKKAKVESVKKESIKKISKKVVKQQPVKKLPEKTVSKRVIRQYVKPKKTIGNKLEPVKAVELSKLTISEKTLTEAERKEPVPNKKIASSLSKRLINSLRSTYGKHMPENVSYEGKFGYIVD